MKLLQNIQKLYWNYNNQNLINILWFVFLQGPDYDDKTRKVQSERDNLQLQVQVLSEQIEAQTDKIADLEKNLSEKKQQLIGTEDILQRVSVAFY